MQEYEDGVKMTKISDTDNNSCSPNTDSMEILTDMKPVASFATRFQLVTHHIDNPPNSRHAEESESDSCFTHIQRC